MSGRTEQDDERIRVDAGAVRRIGWQQGAVRFLAGAVASSLAAVTAQLAGSALSGPVLALPAILMASPTLIADEQGVGPARQDARGARIGAVGLVAFALTAAALLGRTPTWLALLAASAVWVLVSLALYVAQRLFRRATAR